MITLKLIKKTAEQIFDLEEGSLENPCRKTAFTDGRHAYWLAAMYFAHKQTHAAIAIQRHHASAQNSITRCLNLCQAEPEYKKKVIELFNNIRPYEKTEKIHYGVALFRCAVDALL